MDRHSLRLVPIVTVLLTVVFFTVIPANVTLTAAWASASNLNKPQKTPKPILPTFVTSATLRKYAQPIDEFLSYQNCPRDIDSDNDQEFDFDVDSHSSSSSSLSLSSSLFSISAFNPHQAANQNLHPDLIANLAPEFHAFVPPPLSLADDHTVAKYKIRLENKVYAWHLLDVPAASSVPLHKILLRNMTFHGTPSVSLLIPPLVHAAVYNTSVDAPITLNRLHLTASMVQKFTAAVNAPFHVQDLRLQSSAIFDAHFQTSSSVNRMYLQRSLIFAVVFQQGVRLVGGNKKLHHLVVENCVVRRVITGNDAVVVARNIRVENSFLLDFHLASALHITKVELLRTWVENIHIRSSGVLRSVVLANVHVSHIHMTYPVSWWDITIKHDSSLSDLRFADYSSVHRLHVTNSDFARLYFEPGVTARWTDLQWADVDVSFVQLRRHASIHFHNARWNNCQAYKWYVSMDAAMYIQDIDAVGFHLNDLCLVGTSAHAALNESYTHNVLVTRATLKSSTLHHIHGHGSICFDTVILQNVKFSYLDLSTLSSRFEIDNSKLSKVTFADSILQSFVYITNSQLFSSTFRNMTFKGPVDFTGSKLSSVIIEDSVFENVVSFSNSRLTRIEFKDVTFRNYVDFSKAAAKKITFFGCTFIKAPNTTDSKFNGILLEASYLESKGYIVSDWYIK